MWHQLLDKTDSYLETSASAMFTFAIARGVNRGWLQPVYAPIAQAGWRALEQRMRPDGTLDGACVADDRRVRRRLLLQPARPIRRRCRASAPC